MRVFFGLKIWIAGANEAVAFHHMDKLSKRHILIGFGLILFFFIALGGVAASAYLPGFSGEIGRMCLALITSPFLMETSIFFLALTLLFAINGWRRNRDGDDYVALDENGVPVRED